MSHGQHRQLEIAMALATRPTMLLLDEPMAGLGIEESHAMSALLAGIKGHYTILLLSTTWTWCSGLPTESRCWSAAASSPRAPPTEIRNHPEVRIAYLGEDEDEFAGVLNAQG